MITCSKLYTDIPFAHRQPNHKGHCRFIHGHNWSFEITFACDKLDPCGFVVDFGDLKFIKNWFSDVLDHSLLLNKDDPLLASTTTHLQQYGICNVVPVFDCSCEGIAEFVASEVNELLCIHDENMGRKVRCIKCTVFEDSKNSATFLV